MQDNTSQQHPHEAVPASPESMSLAQMILSDCGCSTAISDRLQRRVAGRIQLHIDSVAQQLELERGSLFAENQRKQQLQGQVDMLLAAMNVIALGELPDGDYANMPTMIYAEEVYKAAQRAPIKDSLTTDRQAELPGVYAILYRDNWDGEWDVYHLLAEYKDGKWYAEESGKELLQYEGDAILRVWPLTDDKAQSVTRDVLAAMAVDVHGEVAGEVDRWHTGFYEPEDLKKRTAAIADRYAAQCAVAESSAIKLVCDALIAIVSHSGDPAGTVAALAEWRKKAEAFTQNPASQPITLPDSARYWAYRRYGSEPEKGYTIVSRGAHNTYGGSPIGYLGDGELAGIAAQEICNAHNVELFVAMRAERNAQFQFGYECGWHEFSSALLRATASSSYQSMPIDPTPEMIDAGAEGDSQFYEHAKFVYQKMRAAAPKDPRAVFVEQNRDKTPIASPQDWAESVLTDEELWSIRNHTAVTEVLDSDGSQAISVKMGRAVLRAAAQKDPRQAFAEYHLGKPFSAPGNSAEQKGGA